MSNLPPPPPPPPPSGRGPGGSSQPPQRPRIPGRPSGQNNNGQGQGQSRGPGLPRWSVWVLLGLLVLLLFGSRLIPTNNGKELSYGEFMTQVKAGAVKKANYNNASGHITGELT